MSVYKREGSPYFYFNFVVARRKFSGSTGCTIEREAKAFERQRRLEAKAATQRVVVTMTLDVALARYWQEVGQHHKRPDQTWWSLEYLQDKLGPQTLLTDIDNTMVAKLVAGRRSEIALNKFAKLSRRVSPSTVNRSVTEPLRKVLNRARDVWDQQLKKINWALHMLKEPKERVRELTADEDCRLFAALNPQHHEIVRFTIRMGLRVTECVQLTWDKIDWGNRRIHVFGKGDKLAPVPMPQDVRDLLWGIQGRHPERVFSWQDRGEWKPFTYSGVDSQLGRALKRARISDFHFHDLRHTAATRLLRDSGNLKMVQKLLRHENIETTVKYAHVLDDDLRDALDAMEKHVVTTKVTTPSASDGTND